MDFFEESPRSIVHSPFPFYPLLKFYRTQKIMSLLNHIVYENSSEVTFLDSEGHLCRRNQDERVSRPAFTTPQPQGPSSGVDYWVPQPLMYGVEGVGSSPC